MALFEINALDEIAQIINADGFPLDHLIVCQVIDSHVTGDIQVALHRIGDVLGDRSVVKGVRTLARKRLKRIGVCLVSYPCAGWFCRAIISVDKIFERHWVPEEQSFSIFT